MKTPLLSLVIAAFATLLYLAVKKTTGLKLTTFDAHYVLRVIPNPGVRNVGTDVDNVSKVLLARITNLNQKGTLQTINNNLLDIKVDDVSDTALLTNILTTNTSLEFREVYTLRELGMILSKADELLGNAPPKPVESPTDTKANDTPAMVTYSNLDPAPGNNKGPSITTYLYYGQTYNQNGNTKFPAYIGHVKIEDSADLNMMLNDPRLVNALPKDTRFLYATFKDDRTGEKSNYLELYAVRTYPGQVAELDNDDIARARQDYSPTGAVEIMLSFKPTGAKKWLRMTTANVDKPIAIIVNNLVVTAPYVNAPIEGGEASISGGFTVGDAYEIANQLNAGRMPAEVSIVKQEMSKRNPPFFPGNPIIYPVVFVVAGAISFLLLSLLKRKTNQPSVQS